MDFGCVDIELCKECTEVLSCIQDLFDSKIQNQNWRHEHPPRLHGYEWVEVSKIRRQPPIEITPSLCDLCPQMVTENGSDDIIEYSFSVRVIGIRSSTDNNVIWEPTGDFLVATLLNCSYQNIQRKKLTSLDGETHE